MTLRKLAGLLVVAVLILTGCAGQNPNTAAVVGGTTISEDEVQQYSTAIAAKAQAELPVARGFVIRVLIKGLLAEQIAEKRGLAINVAERDALIGADQFLAEMSADPATKEVAAKVADLQYLAKKLGVDSLKKDALAIPVTLNPRYGTWSPEAFELYDTSGSLSNQAPTTAAPTPAG